MAHIKVVRRSMRPEEWTDLRFGWLKRHVYKEKWEITNLMIRDARQTSEMEFQYYSEEYRPLKKGDMLGGDVTVYGYNSLFKLYKKSMNSVDLDIIKKHNREWNNT